MRSAPRYFLLGAVTLEDEGDVWVAAGFSDSSDEDGIPPEALPLATAPLGQCALIFLVIDGVIRGFVRTTPDKPLSWLDFGWLCATWPHASMVYMVPLAELDAQAVDVLSTMSEFTDEEAEPTPANEQQAGGGDQ